MKARLVILLILGLVILVSSCNTSLGTPTPSPTVQPTPTQEFLWLEIISVTSPVSPGNDAILEAQTLPNALCYIIVYYKSGPSSAQGLTPQQADNSGYVSWTWMVGTNTTPGFWEIIVVATTQDGQCAFESTHFQVW